MPIDEVVDVVTVRNRFVAATRPVHVAGLMGATGVIGRAPRGVVTSLIERVFVHVVAMYVVQVPVVQVVDVAVVVHCGVTTPASVIVIVPVVLFAAHKRLSPLLQ